MLTIKAISFSAIGQRPNNEDALYPPPEVLNKNNKLFIVCDGVGGHNKGEVAADLVCEYFPQHFQQLIEETPIFEAMHQALKRTEINFTEYLDSNTDAKGMGCTITVLYQHQQKYYLAWAGDSRIYHIRNGEVLYQTKDHSVVNDLIDKGEITPEEAKTHPRRNSILRVVQGSELPTKLDTHLIENAHANDYFMLCSDGVLEQVENKHIQQFFKTENELSTIKNQLLKQCGTLTKDNHTAYVLKLKKEGSKKPLGNINENATNKLQSANSIKPRKSKKWLVILLGILLTGIALALVFNKNKKDSNEKQQPIQKMQPQKTKRTLKVSPRKNIRNKENRQTREKMQPKPIKKTLEKQSLQKPN